MEGTNMKIGFLSDATKILIFAATIIITCILVVLGFRAANIAKGISQNATQQMTDLNNDIRDGDFMKFDCADVNGSEVINFIKKHLGDYTSSEAAPIYIYVKTTESENTYTNKAYFSSISNFTDTKYIKPTALFIGEVIKNENKVIVGVSFIQQ